MLRHSLLQVSSPGHSPQPPLVLSQLSTSALLPAVALRTTRSSSVLVLALASCLLCHDLPSSSGWFHIPSSPSSNVLLSGIRAPWCLFPPAVASEALLTGQHVVQTLGEHLPQRLILSCLFVCLSFDYHPQLTRLLKGMTFAYSFLFPQELLCAQ